MMHACYIAMCGLQESESALTTEHSFTFSDDDEGDQIQVEVYEDPVYGTPVFKTVSGMTKCPHEPHTLAREKVNLIATHVRAPASSSASRYLLDVSFEQPHNLNNNTRARIFCAACLAMLCTAPLSLPLPMTAVAPSPSPSLSDQ